MRLEIEYDPAVGAWYLTSPDEPGLNLCGQDVASLLRDVPTAIGYLNAHNGTNWLEPANGVRLEAVGGKRHIHWTEESAEAFQHSLASEFVRFIEQAMAEEGINQSELAARLGISAGRVSQVLNSPASNFTLKKMIEYARAVHRKISIVGYDDGDASNERGPVFGEIFSTCWSRLSKPRDFFDLESSSGAQGEWRGREVE